MAEEISWFPVSYSKSPKKIIATYGVSGGQLVAIAYHYEFNDFNLDGRSTICEKAVGLLVSQEQEFNMEIGLDIMTRAVEPDFPLNIAQGDELRKKALLIFLSDMKNLTVQAVNFVYFNTLVGMGVSQTLTAAGVTGVKKFIYSLAIKSALKNIIPKP